MKSFYSTWRILSLGLLLVPFIACNDNQDRKIKLSETGGGINAGVRTAASVLQVSSQERRTVAIFPFKNTNRDTSIEWLSRGLADMFSSELSQSLHLHVFPVSRLTETATGVGQDTRILSSPENALRLARNNNIDLILTGTFSRIDDVIKIQTSLIDVETGSILRTETVHGSSLERIFTIVDELSRKLQENLPEDVEKSGESPVQLTKMTESVEAFKCYSKALENMEQFSYAEAKACLKKAISHDSSFAKAYMLLTKLHWIDGDENDAYECVQKALERKDRLTEQEKYWMRFLKAEFDGNVPNIISSVRELLELEPNDIEARHRLALILTELRKHDEAIDQYEAIISLDPSQRLAYNQLAYLYLYRGDYATALEYVDRYAALAPEEPNPYDSKGEILLWAGRLQEASDNFKIALSKRSGYEASLNFLSLIYSELDDLNKAETYADRLIESSSSEKTRSQAYIRKAMLQWRFGKIDAAEKNLNLARENAPNSIYPVMVAAEMYRSIGDTVSAHSLYESYFARFEDVAEQKKPKAFELSHVVRFFLEAPVPAGELIPILTNISENEKRALQRYIYQVHLGVLHLRTGDYETGIEYLSQYSEDLLKFITVFPNYGWNMWRYHHEAIQLLPDPPFDTVERFLAAAEEAGRKDLQVIGNYFLAQLYSRSGDKAKLQSTYSGQGTPLEDDWLFIGPFENQIELQLGKSLQLEAGLAAQPLGRSHHDIVLVANNII